MMFIPLNKYGNCAKCDGELTAETAIREWVEFSTPPSDKAKAILEAAGLGHVSLNGCWHFVHAATCTTPGRRTAPLDD